MGRAWVARGEGGHVRGGHVSEAAGGGLPVKGDVKTPNAVTVFKNGSVVWEGNLLRKKLGSNLNTCTL